MNCSDLKDLRYNLCSYFSLSVSEIQNIWGQSIIVYPSSSKVHAIFLILTYPITTCLVSFNYSHTGEKSIKLFK